MADQDNDHILQLINQNEERNRQAFNNGVSAGSHQHHNHHNQFSNHHASSSPFSVAAAGRFTTLVDFDFRSSPVITSGGRTINDNHLSLPTSGMFNSATFNHQVTASNHHHNHHHQHLKAASQAQPSMMQQQQQQQNNANNNTNNNNTNNSANNSLNPNAAYHQNQLAHTHMGHNNPINPGHYTSVMNPNHHQLLTGQIPLTNSMAAPQTSRLVGGTIPTNQLSVSSNNLSLSTTTGTASFMSVNGQSNNNNNFRPASSETTSSQKKSSSTSSSKNGDSPRRTFACPTCGKGFTEKFNMKRHMQIHSQSRPKYICNECSKSFAWKDNFIRHKKAAHATNNPIQYQA